MTLYTVHLPPDAVSAEEVAERSVFVKEGFAFFGFAFTGFWLLAQRLWLEAIAYLARSRWFRPCSGSSACRRAPMRA